MPEARANSGGGAAAGSRATCFFAHFDRNGRVDPHVLLHLGALRELGFSTVFVTTAKLSDDDSASVAQLVREVIQRENAGLDFGSWAEAYRRYGDVLEGDLLLANDSVYAPVGDLRTAVEKLTAQEADFYGMVESLDVAPHLQSWFLLLTPRAYRSTAFREIMALPFATMTKREIIEQAEVGLTCALNRSGLRHAALYQPSETGILSRTFKVNPMHLLWREQIETIGVPYLKVELLRDNPTKVPNVVEWREVVEARSPGLIRLIEHHLLLNGADSPNVEDRGSWLRRLYQRFLSRDLLLGLAGKTTAAQANAALLLVALRLARVFRMQ